MNFMRLLVEVFGVESVPSLGAKQVHRERTLTQALLKQLERWGKLEFVTLLVLCGYRALVGGYIGASL